MNEKVLKWLIYGAGIVCFIVFVSIRSLPLFNALLLEDIIPNYWDKTKYGELYYFNHILHFREEGLPPAMRKYEYSDRHPSVSETDIFTFGDSFFEFSRHKQFPERLADSLNKKVHYVNYDYPLEYLLEHDYNSKKPKLVLFERVERWIPIAFEEEHQFYYKPDNRSALHKKIVALREIIFHPRTEELYDALLKRSYLTTHAYSVIATIKFDLFRYISALTPVYSLNENVPWLFYYDQVNDTKTSFYYQHSEEEINNICDNILDLSKKLKKHFNMELVMLPLPGKYTLYHDIVNNDTYNNFLPRLYKGLEKRDVKFIRVFEDFKNEDDIIYYGTDSHWKKKGIDIALERTINYMKKDSLLNQIISN